MTVVCWDGTTLAADKRMTYGGHFNTVTKIVRVGRYIAGFSGAPQGIGAFVRWVEDGEDPAKFPVSTEDDRKLYVLAVRSDGAVLKFENSPHPIQIEDRTAAAGSGRDYARAAMHLGCNAAEAVAVACRFDESCGNGVDTLTLSETPHGKESEPVCEEERDAREAIGERRQRPDLEYASHGPG